MSTCSRSGWWVRKNAATVSRHPLRRLGGDQAAAEPALQLGQHALLAFAAVERDGGDPAMAERDEERADRRVDRCTRSPALAIFTVALMWSRIFGTRLCGGSTGGRHVRQYAMPSFSR